jgi:hypothetical protein
MHRNGGIRVLINGLVRMMPVKVVARRPKNTLPKDSATLVTSLPVTERDFTTQVVMLMHMYGWLVCHFRPARRADGTWRTPLQADGAGFPDIVAVRPGADGQPGRVIFAELKAEHGRVAPLQTRWLDALRAVPGIEVYMWTPRQLAAEINRVLAYG